MQSVVKSKEPVLSKRMGKMKSPTSVEEFMVLGGFDAIKKAVKIDKESILNEIDAAHLRGRGGAAYPAGKNGGIFMNQKLNQNI